LTNLCISAQQFSDDDDDNDDANAGPGVAVYSVGDDRADIYVGLQLDGLKRYHDISSVNSSVKMQYSLPPDLFCRSDEPQVFDPAADRLLHIKVCI